MTESTHAADAQSTHDLHEHTHPSEVVYLKVAAVLFVLTSIEVGLYYLNMAKLPMVLLLLSLATVKFGIVAMFFMHLKFDSSLFRRFFLVGITLALIVYTIILLTFHVFITDRNVQPKAAVEGPA